MAHNNGVNFDNQSPMIPPKKNDGGVGDFNNHKERYQRYWDSLQPSMRMPAQKPVVLPPNQSVLHDGTVVDSMSFEERTKIELMAKLFRDILGCGTFFVKNPNWVEPPITGTNLDLRNESRVPIGVSNTTLLSYTVPDRFYGSFISFGHMLSNSAAFGTVVWNIMVNGAPLEMYTNFVNQIGLFVNPTPFPMPFRVKPRDVVTVVANQGGFGAVDGWARLCGWIWPAKETTQDGSFREYHTI